MRDDWNALRYLASLAAVAAALWALALGVTATAWHFLLLLIGA